MRVGYLAADPAVVEALLLVRLPYHLSSLTQAAAQVAVEHSPRLKEQIGTYAARVTSSSQRCLRKVGSVHRRTPNFVLVGPFIDPACAWQRLLTRGSWYATLGCRDG